MWLIKPCLVGVGNQPDDRYFKAKLWICEDTYRVSAMGAAHGLYIRVKVREAPMESTASVGRYSYGSLKSLADNLSCNRQSSSEVSDASEQGEDLQ
jgi:hypothetical protein